MRNAEIWTKVVDSSVACRLRSATRGASRATKVVDVYAAANESECDFIVYRDIFFVYETNWYTYYNRMIGTLTHMAILNKQ